MKAVQQTWPPAFAQAYREAGYWKGETIGDMLRARAAATPNLPAVVSGDSRWTYGELDARADTIATGLLASGLRPGDRAILHLPNVAEFLGVVFGMFRAGVLPVFALPAHRETEILHFAEAAEAVAYVGCVSHEGFSFLQLADALVRQLPSVSNVILVQGPNDQPVPERDGFSTLAQLEALGAAATGENISAAAQTATPGSNIAPGHQLSNNGSSITASAQSASDVAFLQLSGGSTGLSKLIPRTHDDYLYSVRRSAEICRLDTSTVYLAALPAAHNFTVSSPGWLGVLYAGGTVVLSPSPAPMHAFPLIEREQVNITAVVPPVALAWLDAAPATRHNLSSLRTLQVGGAKLPIEVARRITPVLGCGLQQVFGMAEGLVNYTRLDDPEEIAIGTQGRPMCPDDEVRIVDDLDNPVPDGTPGHLQTRGPYTIRAYHNAPDANERAFTSDGFYRTGDIVVRRPDGYLVVEGRATDQINRGGEKVSPDEVEDHLLAHPSVHDAAVIAVPDEYLGEKSCAVIVPRDPALKAAAIRSWIRSRGLAAYKIPDQVVFVSAFPTTGVGKVSRRQLRALLRDQLAAGAVAAKAPAAGKS